MQQLHLRVGFGREGGVYGLDGMPVDWPANLIDATMQLCERAPAERWHDVVVFEGQRSFQAVVGPVSPMLSGGRMVLAIRGGRAGAVHEPTSGEDVAIGVTGQLTRAQCHDLKTLLTAAMMGVEVTRRGAPAEGATITLEALNEALGILSGTEDPTLPPDLRHPTDGF